MRVSFRFPALVTASRRSASQAALRLTRGEAARTSRNYLNTTPLSRHWYRLTAGGRPWGTTTAASTWPRVARSR